MLFCVCIQHDPSRPVNLLQERRLIPSDGIELPQQNLPADLKQRNCDPRSVCVQARECPTMYMYRHCVVFSVFQHLPLHGQRYAQHCKPAEQESSATRRANSSLQRPVGMFHELILILLCSVHVELGLPCFDRIRKWKRYLLRDLLC